MNASPAALLPLARYAGLVALLAAASGAAFAAWSDHGARIFLSLAESGLAWCF